MNHIPDSSSAEHEPVSPELKMLQAELESLAAAVGVGVDDALIAHPPVTQEELAARVSGSLSSITEIINMRKGEIEFDSVQVLTRKVSDDMSDRVSRTMIGDDSEAHVADGEDSIVGDPASIHTSVDPQS